MKFSDFICKDAIRTQLEADQKESVIRGDDHRSSKRKKSAKKIMKVLSKRS